MQLAKIIGMPDRAGRQRALRIVGLVLQRSDPVDRREEILGLDAAGGAVDPVQAAMANLPPELQQRIMQMAMAEGNGNGHG